MLPAVRERRTWTRTKCWHARYATLHCYFQCSLISRSPSNKCLEPVVLMPGQPVCNLFCLACLRKYQEVNGTLPERIFLYRDGVGDGMIPMVKSYEIEQLVKSFSSVAPNYKFVYTLILFCFCINIRLRALYTLILHFHDT